MTTNYTITEGEDFYIIIRVIVNGIISRNVTVNLNFQNGGELELSVDVSVSWNLQVPFDDLNVTREDNIMLKLNTTDRLVELGSIISMHITIHKNGKLYIMHKSLQIILA